MLGRRIEKVNSLIAQTLAQAIQELGISELAMVNVQRVDTSADLREVKVYLDIIGDHQKRDEVLEFLKNHKSKLQNELKKLELKFTPVIYFDIDTGIEQLGKVEEILSEFKDNGTN